MIVDEFGRPFHQPIGLITPKWVERQCAPLFRDELASYTRLMESLRISDLRESCGGEESHYRIGNTVQVRPPQRLL